MKKIINYFVKITSVFILGYFALNSSINATLDSLSTDFSNKEVFQYQQNKYNFNDEGTQKESFSLNSNQNFNFCNEVNRKQVQTLFVFTSFAKIDLIQKKSFEILFVKKNLLNLFFSTLRIIFPFHYFW